MITIEKPNINDVMSIQQVLYEVWLVTYPNKETGITVEDIEEKYKDRFSQKNIVKRKNEIQNLSDTDLILVAKEDGVVIGVCKAKKEELFNELSAIYILPSYQRAGVGKLFWDKVIEFFGTEKDIIVHVATYNEKAINFYKKIGFIDTGKRFTEEKFKMPISGSYLPEMEMVIQKNKKPS
jgi:ribosomal protein S18 acetylase RimI-like enzyme